MIQLVLLLFLAETIDLKFAEPLDISTLAGRNYRKCPDGTFLLLNISQAFHFDAKGNLIRRLGKKGQGPGEFTYVATGMWDGQRYAFYTEGNKVVIFDKDGQLEKEIKTEGHLIRLGWTGDSLFGYHTGGQTVLKQKHKGLVLFETLDEIHHLNNLSHFHETSEDVLKFNFNNENHWVTHVDNHYFVADEMTPEVWIYDENLQLKGHIDLELLMFNPSPEKWYRRQGTTVEWRLKWYYSWSRLVGFYAREDDMLVAYEVANEEDPTTGKTIIAVLDHSGKPMAKPRETLHQFMNADAQKFYILNEVDTIEDPLPKYQIEVQTW